MIVSRLLIQEFSVQVFVRDVEEAMIFSLFDPFSDRFSVISLRLKFLDPNLRPPFRLLVIRLTFWTASIQKSLDLIHPSSSSPFKFFFILSLQYSVIFYKLTPRQLQSSYAYWAHGCSDFLKTTERIIQKLNVKKREFYKSHHLLRPKCVGRL
jgi:hypothetical protein